MRIGGYPEVVERRSEARRVAWFKSYVTTILQRDIRDLANIEGLVDLPRLLALVAARAGGLLNFAEVSRSVGFAQCTLKRYFALLEATFLVETLPARSGTQTKRLVKAPKVFLGDMGLLSYLQGLTWERLQLDPTLAGALTENFVVSELRKQATWSELRVELFHFRTNTDWEVDIVIENEGGRNRRHRSEGERERRGERLQGFAGAGADNWKEIPARRDHLHRKRHRAFRRRVVCRTNASALAINHIRKGVYASPIIQFIPTQVSPKEAPRCACKF